MSGARLPWSLWGWQYVDSRRNTTRSRLVLWINFNFVHVTRCCIHIGQRQPAPRCMRFSLYSGSPSELKTTLSRQRSREKLAPGRWFDSGFDSGIRLTLAKFNVGTCHALLPGEQTGGLQQSPEIWSLTFSHSPNGQQSTDDTQPRHNLTASYKNQYMILGVEIKRFTQQKSSPCLPTLLTHS